VPRGAETGHPLRALGEARGSSVFGGKRLGGQAARHRGAVPGRGLVVGVEEEEAFLIPSQLPLEIEAGVAQVYRPGLEPPTLCSTREDLNR
jgi:hypothetical protein